mgnify:CR=1 FL=1
MENLEMEYKFRIIKDEKKVFGEGPCILLEEIDKLGSLSKACEQLNMSYSKGWSIINNAEKILGYELLETQTGGIDGGGSHLTQNARKLIKAYRAYCAEAEEVLQELFKKYFRKL